MDTTETVKTTGIRGGEDIKLKLSEKIAIVIGNTPTTFHYQMIQMYLLFFYTDIMKISAAYVAGLFLVVRIIDAVIAPVFGALIDKIKTPWGKYTPWFVILGVPFGIFGWLTFTTPNLSPNGKLVYATITYIAYSVLSAIMAIPGGAVVPTVTKRVDDRVSIGQLGFLFIIFGGLVVNIFAVPIYKALGGGNDAKGFSLFMAIAAVFTGLVAIYQAVRIKERYIAISKKDEKSPSFKQMVSATFTNKAAVIVYIFLFGNSLSAGIRSGVQIHFFKYFFHNESLMAIFGIIVLIPTFLGVIFSQPVIKRFGLKASILAGVVVNLVTAPILLFIPANKTGVMIYIVCSAIACLVSGFGTTAQGALMPAAIDYTEWKTGLNLNAFMSSFNGFVQTFATAISGAIAAGALNVIGYVPGVEQSSFTLWGLKVLIFVLPAVFITLQMCVVWFDLTEEKQIQIAKDLAERRKNAEANVTI